MKGKLVSKCDQNFVIDCLSSNIRLDNRGFKNLRKLSIRFHEDFGSVEVSLGESRVLAVVSYNLEQPKLVNKSSGYLFINVEFSPMANLAYTDYPRTSNVRLTRALERLLKESQCIDLESLCVIESVKAWCLRLDVHVLNDDGNVSQCSSIASILAVAHSRRPAVTVDNGNITIHHGDDQTPVSVPVLHWPVISSFVLTPNMSSLVLDPTAAEEEAAPTIISVGVNRHREICLLEKYGGKLTLTTSSVIMATKIAFQWIDVLTFFLRNCLDNDMKKRDNHLISKTSSQVSSSYEWIPNLDDIEKFKDKSKVTPIPEKSSSVT